MAGAVLPVLDALRASGYAVERLRGTAFTLLGVADGRHDCVVKEIAIENGVHRVWGAAAAALICREAGAGVVDPQGADWCPRAPVVIACNASGLEILQRALWSR